MELLMLLIRFVLVMLRTRRNLTALGYLLRILVS